MCGLSVGSLVNEPIEVPNGTAQHSARDEEYSKPQLSDEEMWEHLRQIARGS